jgi:ABC-type branched-subunit amino acid transport system ATPase component
MVRRVLEVQDLWVGNGPDAACRDVTFTVGAGQVTSVLGGEGAGKSQLLRCIGLDSLPSAGTVRIDGVDVTGASDEERRGRRGRSIELVHPPVGWDLRSTSATRSTTVPAAGVRQRIQIARALTNDIDVLLLDEPFVGVEPAVRIRITELLDRLLGQGHAAVVIATRDASLAHALGDEVVVLDHGAVVEAGPSRKSKLSWRAWRSGPRRRSA